MKEYQRGFRHGFTVGALVIFIVAMIAISSSGCRLDQKGDGADQPDSSLGPVSAILYAEPGEDTTDRVQDLLHAYPGRQVSIQIVIRERPAMTSATRDSIRRMGGVSGDDWLKAGSAAKVAAVMLANDITVGDVADFVHQYGWQLVRAPLPSPHWTPAAPGTYPIVYYNWEMTGAVGDTILPHYLPAVSGTYRLRVRAVDARGTPGPWSEVGWYGNSSVGALPGVTP